MIHNDEKKTVHELALEGKKEVGGRRLVVVNGIEILALLGNKQMDWITICSLSRRSNL